MESSKCHACGTKLKKYKHNLSPALVDTLLRFTIVHHNLNKEDTHLIKNCNFNSYQNSNFQKLKYFGLVEKGEVSGTWLLTKKGMYFTQNISPCEQYAITFKGNVTELASDVVWLHEYASELPEYQKNFDVYEPNFKPMETITKTQNKKITSMPVKKNKCSNTDCLCHKTKVTKNKVNQLRCLFCGCSRMIMPGK